MVDFPDASVKCPYVGFKQSCRDLALSCPKFVHIAGTNPNTGEPVNKYGCADSFIPMLLIENSQQQRQTGAAVESFRNAVVAINGRTLEQIAQAQKITREMPMKVTIVNAENRVIVDGAQKPNIDCSALPAYVSVIQWDEASSSGWIEFVNDGHGVFLPNVKIVDFAPFRHLVQAWEAAG